MMNGRHLLLIHHSSFIIHRFLNPVHRVEKVFALGVDVDAEFVAGGAEAFFERGDGRVRVG